MVRVITFSPARSCSTLARRSWSAMMLMSITLLGATMLRAQQLASSNTRADACPESLEPAHLPGLSDITDSAATLTSIRSLSASATGATLRLTVLFASSTAAMIMDITGADLDLAERVRAAVEERLRAKDQNTVRARLIVHLGPVASIEVERSHYCPPEPLEGARTMGSAIARATLDDLDELRRAGPFKLRITVDSTGRVVHTEFLQKSGSKIQDDLALTAASQRRFVPARQDGLQVGSTFDIDSRRP
jgi:hypothetical protein